MTMTETPPLAPAPPVALSLSFGDLARLGRNDWWRYALAIVGVFGLGTALAFALLELFLALGWSASLVSASNPETASTYGLDSLPARLGAFALVMGTVIAFLPFARIFLPWLHRRPWRSFITARARFAWGRAGLSFICMFALFVASFLLQLGFASDELHFSFEPVAFAAFAALSLVLVPLQVLTEELLFRGWLLQAVGRLSTSLAVRVIVPTLFFTLAHMMNPELSYGALWVAADYALAGLYLSFLALKGGGLEFPAGVHFATNMFVILIARPAISAVQTPALFTDTAPALGFSVLGGVVLFGLHYLLIFRLAPRLRGG